MPSSAKKKASNKAQVKEKPKTLIKLKLYGVIANQLEMKLGGSTIWDLVEPYISDALQKGGDDKYSTEDIRKFITSRDMQLWISFDESGDLYGCAVTQIINYPNEKRLLYLVVAGKKLDFWFEQHELVDEWAKKQGCRAIEAFARKGWERLHTKRNTEYKHIHSVLRRKL